MMLVATAAIMYFSIPPLLTHYVKKTLSELRGYDAKISGVGINFLRGGYTIDSMKITPTGESREVPFLSIAEVDVSIQWESLLLGNLVATIYFQNPTINFVASEKNSRSPGATNWSATLQQLSFLPINQVRLKDGVVSFIDFSTDPPVDVFLQNIDLEIQNLTNARHDGALMPSRLYARAHSSGDGALSVVMKINTRKDNPDLDMDLKFENVNLRPLRQFLTAHANVDVLQGNFNLYSEVTVLDGRINGYVKPQLDNFMFNGKSQPFRVFMGDGPALSAERVENAHLVTRVPLEGQIAGATSQFWPRLWNLFRNASIEGIERNTKDAFILASAE